MPDDHLIDDLRAIVGDAHVLTSADTTAGYAVDWTGRFRGSCRAVVRPATAEQVADVVRACAGARVSLVPQGGNTGLVGGATPAGDEVVLSLRRLDTLGEVDRAAAQVDAGAGVVLERLQAHAAAAGLEFAVDLAARGSATVGGMVATNAGGVHVLRYGSMRAQLAGVEVVLANGERVRRMGGLLKDNAGYDLAGLVCGSEGTLAIVTEARLRLVAQRANRVVALIGVDDLAAAVDLLAALRGLDALVAAEVVFADGLALVAKQTGEHVPLDPFPGCAVVVECAADDDPTGALANVASTQPSVRDVAVASDGPGRARLWSWRDRHTEAVASLGVPHKLDVTLPIAALAAFERDVRTLVEQVHPGATTVIWGHLGDGNLHVNVVGPPPDDDAVDDAVLRLVAERGGSVSAEHGIGRVKRRWLTLGRSDADVAAMVAIKRALDPAGVLNPAVLFPEAAW